MAEYLLLILAFTLGCIVTGAIAKAWYLKRLAAEKVAQAQFYGHMMKQINHGIERLDYSIEAAYAGIVILDRMLHRIPASLLFSITQPPKQH